MEWKFIKSEMRGFTSPSLCNPYPRQLYATKEKDASELSIVSEAHPWGAIIDGPGGEWLDTFYYTTERDPRQRPAGFDSFH